MTVAATPKKVAVRVVTCDYPPRKKRRRYDTTTTEENKRPLQPPARARLHRSPVQRHESRFVPISPSPSDAAVVHCQENVSEIFLD